jgi:hypothetical protein
MLAQEGIAKMEIGSMSAQEGIAEMEIRLCLYKRVSQRWRLDYAYTRGLKLSIYKRVMQRWVIHLQEGNAEIGSGSVVYLYRSC